MTQDSRYLSVRQPLLARNVVATSQPLAAQAGLRMLWAGGNAVDAAVATAIALTVVEPTSNGIGSDAFAILWDGEALHGLNASGRSPAGWTPERFANLQTMPQRGWDTVTVPGAVSAWRALSERFGRLPFRDLFEPAIAYAREGYAVSPVIARSWQRAAEVLHHQPGFAEAFMPGGSAPTAGQTFRLPAMADTLSRIAETGGEDFYLGDLARRMVDFSNRCGGVMSLEDLAGHQADWCGTVSLEWYGYEIHEIPPNGQGIAALIALGILQEFGGLDRISPDSPESIHLQIEAMKLAFADLHQYVADADHMEVTPASLLDGAYLRGRAWLIDRSRAAQPEFGMPPNSGTVYLTAADERGMMVSFIQSNYMGFGSGVVVPGTGISLQNRGCGFRSQPGHANSVGPRKRPFHTIIPGFVTQGGQPAMSFGVMGGAMQAQGHLQMAIRVLLNGQNPQEAADAPRWQVMEGGSVAVETAMPPTVVERLRTLGHEVEVQPGWTNQAFGGAQLIRRNGDGYVAGTESRKDGAAVGF
ncbi:gamma-glutamyltransferase family protein [Fimbriimonas ginsengisoli]|uniref:Gamma-glutamyltransferase n=1 Tax=Fimbriimonas ginsengisoli Gsoil 348 TaxID=661478 RepID=A0A068NSN8_FIMGI|nr:gamma-glutamyltransferase family protein [Fimbriimonas ginsengisoli]AIE86372.1 gamma-glutamyltransferase [Fimbriimonas ginsengisoli Gsoil 348]